MDERINRSVFAPSLPTQESFLPPASVGTQLRSLFTWLHIYRGFWLLFVLLTSCIVVFSVNYYPAYQVTLNGVPLGMVEQKSAVAPALSQAEETASRLLGREYHFTEEAEYRLVYTYGNQYTSSAAMERALLNSVEELNYLYVLRVDGTPVGASENQFVLFQALSQILHAYQDDSVQSARFANTVSIHQEHIKKTMEKSSPQLLSILQAKNGVDRIYIVQPGDTLSSIAKSFDVSPKILSSLNPGLTEETVSEFETILLEEAAPLLSVYTEQTVTHPEEIPFSTKTIPDSSLYEGTQQVKTAGVKGEKQVTEVQTLKNDKVISSTVTATVVTKAPVTEVIASGTKERPKTASTGSFQRPAAGTITSPFGYRYIFGSTSFHSGIDIANKSGSPICAADGGKVTYTGYKGSYGNLVIVTHDNGTQTYYAHCSKILVSTGTSVAKGQQIARMGATGRATGSHLHFEIRINGTAVNPISYLP
jgi:murein DD-endopeptidase MepM/ murein hydrolase activator NlpD